jgi:hypothetical protein
MSTVAFSTIGSHRISLSQTPKGAVRVQLKAALNLDPSSVETGWVLWSEDSSAPRKVEVRETGPDTGLFVAGVSPGAGVRQVEASYGYLASRKSARLAVRR